MIFLLGSAGWLAAAPTAAHQPGGAYSVVSRDANSRIWERTTYEMSPSGEKVPHTHKYHELATGMCYQKGGQWVESREEIVVLPDGSAAAVQGCHQAYFPPDIYNGQIEVVTPDGRHLKSRPLGISYFDGSKNVLIGELKDSVGQLVGSNQVVYPDAFTGVKADLRYTYKRGSFEQDIILREQPPGPGQYKLNAARARLQLLTEFFNTPEPEKQVRPVNKKNGLSDTTLKFGGMKMVPGRAFVMGDLANKRSHGRSSGVPVYKSWARMGGGRSILIEEVPMQEIGAQLQTLPVAVARSMPKPVAGSVLNQVSSSRLLPSAQAVETGTKMMQLARADLNEKPGVVLDYIEIPNYDEIGGTDDGYGYTFQSDTTYYINGDLTLDGPVIIEGNTVIKFNEDAVGEGIYAWGGIVYQTGPYRMAVLTSANDDSVGETITGSTGTPAAGADIYLMDLSGQYSPLKYLRFAYAGTGFEQDFACEENLCEVWDSQFVQCTYQAIITQNTTAKLHNVLFSNCGQCVYGENDSSILEIDGDYITSDQCGSFYASPIPECIDCGAAVVYVANLTNCIFTALGTTLPEPANSEPTVIQLSSGSGLYQSTAGGNYYLDATWEDYTDPYYQSGTTVGIDATVLAEIRQKTTDVPYFLSSYFGPLNPLVERDADALNPGYHYDPLDWIVSGVSVSGALTIYAGTDIGYLGRGFNFSDGASVTFSGLPFAPVQLVPCSQVQEQSIGTPDYAVATDYHINSSINGRFTRFSSVIFDGYFNLQFTSCEFEDGILEGWGWTNECHGFTNCLFDRTGIYAFWSNTGSPPPVNNSSFGMQNCTLRSGTLSVANMDSFNVTDTAFAGTTIAGYGTPSHTNLDYNAYLKNSNRLNPHGTHDVIVSNLVADLNGITTSYSYGWQTGSLGDYYLPTTSPIINMGHTNADLVGLYYYTTQTNGVKETNSTVDIGYHYFVADAGGSGTDFWLAFNELGSLPSTIAISGPSVTSGTVSVPGMGFSQPFSVIPDRLTTVYIPSSVTISDDDTIQWKGIHVTADHSISVSGTMFDLDEDRDEGEAFLVYPTSMLGTNYCLMARPANVNYGGYRSQFVIVATTNSTSVTITPSATANLINHSGTNLFTISLQQGQTYQLGSAGYLDDVTGTIISSTQPIAIVAGANGAKVPNQSFVFSPSMLYEEQIPVQYWGRQALGFPLAPAHGDSYRVLAAYDGTQVTSNGVVVATLQKGQSVDLFVYDPVEIRANNPIQVALFSFGADYIFRYTSGEILTTNSPAFEMLVLPTGHYVKSCIITTPPLLDYYSAGLNDYALGASNYLNIIVEQSATLSTYIDGQPVPEASFTQIGNSGYYGAQVSVVQGGHTVNSSRPVEVLAYGYSIDDAYGYIGGTANPPLAAVLDGFSVPATGATNLDVLANDVFTNRSAVTVGIVSGPLHGGTTSVNSSKNIVYTPESGASGSDQFTYQITEAGRSDTNVVMVQRNP